MVADDTATKPYKRTYKNFAGLRMSYTISIAMQCSCVNSPSIIKQY